MSKKTARQKIYDRAKKVRDKNIEEGAIEEGEIIQKMLDSQEAEELAEEEEKLNDEGVDVSTIMDESIPDAIENPDELLEEDEDDPYAEEEEEEEKKEEEEEEEINPEDKEISDIIEVKVGGKVFKVSQKEVDDFGGIETYQKHRSANIRLRTAATVLAQAQESLTEIEKLLDKPASEDPTQQDASKKASAKTAVDALFSGDEEQATEALSKLVQNREVPTEQLDKLHAGVDAAQAAATLYQDDINRQISETNEVVSEHFADINSNPDLKELMFKHFKTLQDNPDNEGRELKYLAIDAGNWVRGLLNKPNISDTVDKETDELEEKRKAKVKVKRKLPHDSSSSTRRETKKKPRSQTKSEAIAAMKLARGQ